MSGLRGGHVGRSAPQPPCDLGTRCRVSLDVASGAHPIAPAIGMTSVPTIEMSPPVPTPSPNPWDEPSLHYRDVAPSAHPIAPTTGMTLVPTIGMPPPRYPPHKPHYWDDFDRHHWDVTSRVHPITQPLG